MFTKKCAAAAVGVAVLATGVGVAQAAPAKPTATIRSTVFCYSLPQPSSGQQLAAAPSAAVQVKTGSGAELVSGTISGLVAGHKYVYLSNLGNLYREPESPLGTAASNGTLHFTYVLATVDPETASGKLLHAGSSDAFSIFDAATIGNNTDPTPVLTGKTSAITVNSTCGTLRAGSVQAGLETYNGKYTLVQQTDGNLVLRQGATAVWNSKTAGHPGAYTVMQPDGNLVVRSAAGGALWNSKTAGHPGAYLSLQNDRNLVVYGPKALWQSHTAV